MKLYITGSVGSGKSTLAERISEITNIKCFHLDELVHYKDENSSWGNSKRQDDEIERIFNEIIMMNSFIIEDNGRECFVDGMEIADKIVVLDIALNIRKYRIVSRYIKQICGLEKCNYKPNLSVLKSMFKWLKNYESGKDGTKLRLNQFSSKVIYLHNKKEVESFCKTLI